MWVVQALSTQLLALYHDSYLGEHSGVQTAYPRFKRHFYGQTCLKLYYSGSKDVMFMPDASLSTVHHLTCCNLCMCTLKHGSTSPWILDFVEQLPKSRGKDTILVVICKFSKYAHFISLTHPFSATKVAKFFLDSIIKLHGFLSLQLLMETKFLPAFFGINYLNCQALLSVIMLITHIVMANLKG